MARRKHIRHDAKKVPVAYRFRYVLNNQLVYGPQFWYDENRINDQLVGQFNLHPFTAMEFYDIEILYMEAPQ